MPAPMSQPSDDIPALTNNDIETLYDIVRTAQTLSGGPFHALFEAYDKVLAERHINADDSGVYFNFIIELGRRRPKQVDGEEEDGLVERFQAMLLEMGIEVEVNEDGVGIEDTRDLGGLHNEEGRGNERARVQSRRGSFDSFFDGTAHSGRDMDHEPIKTAPSRRGSHGTASDAGAHRRSRSQSQARAKLLSQLPLRGRVDGKGARRSVSASHDVRPRRSGSVSSQGSLQIRRTRPTATIQSTVYDGDDSETTDSFDFSNIQVPGVNAPIPGAPYKPAQYQGLDHVEHEYRPSDTQMLDDAAVFEHRRNLSATRQFVQTWRNRARERREQYDGEMEAKAAAFDRRNMTSQSFGLWRAKFLTRQNMRETEHFFERLETRAGRARNLFLLTKAFTHWAQCAEDEIERTSVARRHILRTKYFNAWRDITAVNELKVQHHVLRRFLHVWRRRAAAVRQDNLKAVAHYEDNLVFKIYWLWFWTFCETAAPQFNARYLKKHYLTKWAEITRVLQEREDAVAIRHSREVKRKTLQGLRDSLATSRAMEQQALEFRHRKLIANALTTLSKEAQLAPILSRFKRRVDVKVVTSTFQRWRLNARSSRQARGVDRMRVMRNHWTTWNDKLRIGALEAQINDRVLVQTMYKWALAARVSLFVRVHNRTLIQNTFNHWIAKARDRQIALEDAERRFAGFKRRQLLRSWLRKIEETTIARKDDEYLALSVYEPKLKGRIFGTLLDKNDHLQQLNTWASSARFYVLTTMAFKKLNNATENARRNRRREMYAQFRRGVKLNLVRRKFNVWREKLAQCAAQERQADQALERHVQRTASSYISAWHDFTAARHEKEQQASDAFNNRILIIHLTTWTQRHQHLQRLSSQAKALRQESQEVAAGKMLGKLDWALFNRRRLEDNALALFERNFEKHRKAMIRFWAQQAVARMPIQGTGDEQEEEEPEDVGRDGDNQEGDSVFEDGHEEVGGDGAGDETRRLENWTAFDENALGLSPTALDLSLSFLPEQSHLPASTQQPPHLVPSSLRRQTQTAPPLSAARPPRVPPIVETSTQQELSADEIPDFAPIDQSIWTSTPMPGYLRTPSKRSVARSKRLGELATSPEKSARRLGAMSAPPGAGYVGHATGRGGVTSFERRLREQGIGGSAVSRSLRKSSARGRVVGFADVEEEEAF